MHRQIYVFSMDASVLRSGQSYLGGLSTALDSEYPVNPIQPLGHSSAVSDNVPQAFPNYLICLHFIRITTVVANVEF